MLAPHSISLSSAEMSPSASKTFSWLQGAADHLITRSHLGVNHPPVAVANQSAGGEAEHPQPVLMGGVEGGWYRVVPAYLAADGCDPPL